MQKKKKKRFLSSFRYFVFSFFVRTRKKRERTQHARSSLSRFSIIIVSDLYQRDREKEWLRERFE